MTEHLDTILFGTGAGAEQFLAGDPPGLGALGFASTTGGGTFRGQDIMPATAIAEHEHARVVVASSYRREILRTLERLDVVDARIDWFIPEENRIIPTAELRQICTWPEDDVIAARLVVHHVGGRGFAVPFNVPWRFERDLVHVLYEADADCVRSMIATGMPPNIHVLPICLGAEDGTVPFHITRNPYGSSMLEPAPDFSEFYCESALTGQIDGIDVTGARHDLVYGHEIEIVRRIEVRTRALDSLAEMGELPLGALPDLLSLDTQGAEHAILIGARQTVRRSVLALVTEFAFEPVYRDQKLFARLLDFAAEAGFYFAGFLQLDEASPHRAPVGQRGKGFTAFGDALFLRRLDTLDGLDAAPATRRMKARKLAFIAITFGYLEYAFQALDYGDRQSAAPAGLQGTVYDVFLERLRDAALQMPAAYLPVERSDLVQGLRQRSETIARTNALAPLTEQSTPIETVLLEHGYRTIAEMVKDRRRAALPYAIEAPLNASNSGTAR